MIPPPPSCTLFPYTTLFRSRLAAGRLRSCAAHGAGPDVDHHWCDRGGRPRSAGGIDLVAPADEGALDRKSTRLNSSHITISYAVFCLKKKTLTPHSSTSYRY